DPVRAGLGHHPAGFIPFDLDRLGDAVLRHPVPDDAAPVPLPGGMEARSCQRDDPTDPVPIDHRPAETGLDHGADPSGVVVLVTGLGAVGPGERGASTVVVVGPRQSDHAGRIALPAASPPDQLTGRVPDQLVDHLAVPHPDGSTDDIPLDPGENTVPGTGLDHPAGVVVRPAQVRAGGVDAARLPSSGVVLESDGAAERIGFGDDPAGRVIATLRPAARRIDRGDALAELVVLELRPPAGGVGDRHDLAGRVVLQAPTTVPPIAELHDPAGSVVPSGRPAFARFVTLDDPSALVVAQPDLLAGRPQLANQAAVGVVLELVPRAVGVDGGRMSPTRVVLVPVGAAHRMGHRDSAARSVQLEPRGGTVRVGELDEPA